MSTKLMNFMAMSWFLSTLISLVMEGSSLATTQNSVINDLTLFAHLPIGSLFTVPVLNFNFFRGIMRILLWDYSFYQDGYQWLRYFWLTTLTSGAVWGIMQAFIGLYGQITNWFRLFL